MALRLLKPTIRTVDLSIARPVPKVRDEHYGTTDHKRWAAEVVKRAGYACEDCGRRGVRLFADHVRAIKDGGARLDLSNGRARCGSCHSAKTARETRERAER